MLSRGLEVHQWMVLATILLLIAQVIGTNTEEGHGKVSVEATEPEPNASRLLVPDFVATNEWQELLPGQSVPRGLHVRLNMETGKREAKLVDYSTAESEKAMHARVIGLNVHEASPIAVSTDISGDVLARENDDVTLNAIDDEIKYDAFEEDAAGFESEKLDQDPLLPAEPHWNHEKIYDVLQALPEPPKIDGIDIHEAHEKLTPAEFRKQIVTLWKKRQAELKEALESLQDDAKYLGKLLQQLKEAEHEGDVEGQLSVLEVLEWEVQDLDKTHVFNFIGGFSILADYLNSTSLPVRARAAWVIGSAAKNYEDGQEWAIDAGVLPLLMESLKLETPNTEEAAKNVFEVKKKSIYALSSIVRSNARGQRLFLRYDGPHLLAGILNYANPTKLQMKVLLFMYDLLAEASYMELHESAFPELFELKKIFQSSEWCERVSTTFNKMAPQLDRQEVGQLVDSMRHQLPACQLNHQASGIKSVVESLAKRV